MITPHSRTDHSSVSWKTRLYGSYVSSGQASGANSLSDRPEEVFRPRAPYIRRIIARYVPPDRRARILDLACGHGAFLYYLKSTGYINVSGVDISREQIDLAHRLGIREVKCRDLLSELKDLSSESIDTVIMMDILEHLEADELFEILDQVFRVLKRTSICIAHVPNAEGLYGMRIRYGDLTHERAFAPTAAEQLFRTVGFAKVQCHEDRPVIHGVKSLARLILWAAATVPHRLLLTAETGARSFILSQNMLITAYK